MTYHIIKSLCLAIALTPVAACAEKTPSHCARETVYDAPFVICRFDQSADIRLFLTAPDGEALGHFERLEETLLSLIHISEPTRR